MSKGSLWRRRGTALVAAVALTLPAGLAAAEPVEVGPAESADVRVSRAAGAAGPELAIVGGALLPETTGGVLDLAISRDGSRAVAVGKEWLQVLSLRTDDPTLLGASTAVFGDTVVLSKDGRTAYVLSENDTLFVVDVSGDRQPRVVRQLYRNRFSPSHAFDMDISRDGRFLYVKHGFVIGGYGKGKGIQVLSLRKPRKPRKVAHVNAPEWGGGIAVSRNGRHLMTASETSDDYVLLYRVAKKTGKPKRVKRLRLPFSADAVAISEDNRFGYVLSDGAAGADLFVGRVDLKRRRLVRTARVEGQEDGLGLAVSSDGRHLFASSWRAHDDEQSFFTLDARTLAPLHGAAGAGLYAPQTVEVSRAGVSKDRVFVPTYTGIMGGQPLLVVFSYR